MGKQRDTRGQTAAAGHLLCGGGLLWTDP